MLNLLLFLVTRWRLCGSSVYCATASLCFTNNFDSVLTFLLICMPIVHCNTLAWRWWGYRVRSFHSINNNTLVDRNIAWPPLYYIALHQPLASSRSAWVHINTQYLGPYKVIGKLSVKPKKNTMVLCKCVWVIIWYYTMFSIVMMYILVCGRGYWVIRGWRLEVGNV